MKSAVLSDAIHTSGVEVIGNDDTAYRRPSKGAIETFDFGGDETSDSTSLRKDTTHRRLKARHIQLIGIGGTIGTALYVSIGNGLLNGGPASLFLAFTIW